MTTWQKVFVIPDTWEALGIQETECERVIFSRGLDDEPLLYWKPRIPIPGRMVHYRDGRDAFLDRKDAVEILRTLARLRAYHLSQDLKAFEAIATQHPALADNFR